MNCVPESLVDGICMDYETFLDARRKLMSLKIKEWFAAL
jgi:hypothetical protein